VGIAGESWRLTVQQQCELLGVPRSTYYYQPRPESAENLRLMRRLDQLYMKRPFFGSRKMAVELEWPGGMSRDWLPGKSTQTETQQPRENPRYSAFWDIRCELTGRESSNQNVWLASETERTRLRRVYSSTCRVKITQKITQGGRFPGGGPSAGASGNRFRVCEFHGRKAASGR
jgi:hypothetical protein